MNVRRSAAALAASAVLCVVAAPAAFAAPSPSPAPVIPSGLYGKNDPTYDGVWRQSLAFLAQHTAGLRPAGQAVDWLAGQQCADGSFAAFRADASKACDAKTMADSNATAAAVQALAAVGGREATVKKAVGWLKSVQNEDGGWAYSPGPGAPSDANSTAIVAGALAAAGEKPDAVKSKGGKTSYDALTVLQLACEQKGVSTAADMGAFAYQPDKAGKLPANADATAAAALGVLGKGLVVEAPKADVPIASKPVACKRGPQDAAQSAMGAADYLATTMAKTGDHLMSAMPGATDQPDYGNTADAVVALAAGGHKAAAAKPLAWLEKNHGAWAKTAGPAGYAQLILAAHAAGADPKAFGGTDLVAQLNAQGPEASPVTGTSGDANDAREEKKDDSSGNQNIVWIVGAGAVAGIGIGILLSGRRKKQQP
ncbi:prenyltransferase/squalene oxidase repeat-containing protein [Streptomyces sp. 12297]|uniref:prenyltransferase/squalene oxidase repeat-containing protein n=1 Tax=Streptomyces sp. NBC_00239 TaxID=2903640 RepID=UPI002E2BB0EF|nr:prenyltransferase/squalene oxidase repeat-containing protein [Streptomyces sp. NBC_00239]